MSHLWMAISIQENEITKTMRYFGLALPREVFQAQNASSRECKPVYFKINN